MIASEQRIFSLPTPGAFAVSRIRCLCLQSAPLPLTNRSKIVSEQIIAALSVRVQGDRYFRKIFRFSPSLLRDYGDRKTTRAHSPPDKSMGHRRLSMPLKYFTKNCRMNRYASSYRMKNIQHFRALQRECTSNGFS